MYIMWFSITAGWLLSKTKRVHLHLQLKLSIIVLSPYLYMDTQHLFTDSSILLRIAETYCSSCSGRCKWISVNFYSIEPDGTPKLRMVWSKAAKSFRLRKVYQPKTYRFRNRLLSDILIEATNPMPTTPIRPVGYE